MKGGADIVDFETSFPDSSFAMLPDLISQLRKNASKNVLISVSINEPNISYGALSLALFGAVISGADIVKLGFANIQRIRRDAKKLKSLSDIARNSRPYITLALKCWVDYDMVQPAHYKAYLLAAQELKLDMVMYDTFYKDRGPITEYIPLDSVDELTKQAHSLHKLIGISGSLIKKDVSLFQHLGVDIIGLTGAVSLSGDRDLFRISGKKVRQIKQLIKSLESKASKKDD